jgi:hypothetical protein
VGLGLWLLFAVLLEPVRTVSCNTSLIDGPYKSAMVPAHLLAAAVLSWRIGRSRWLLAVWAVIVACLVFPALLSLIVTVAVFVAPLVGVALAIAAIANLRAVAPVLPWACLVLGLPASVGYVWLAGANPFCF